MDFSFQTLPFSYFFYNYDARDNNTLIGYCAEKMQQIIFCIFVLHQTKNMSITGAKTIETHTYYYAQIG